MSTVFDPSRHAFAFSNSWSFDDHERDLIREALVEAVAPAIEGIELPSWVRSIALNTAEAQLQVTIGRSLPDSYGLCGGMAFAALDYLHAGIATPRGMSRTGRPTRDTEEGTELRDYLWRRLIDSLKLNASTFVSWMAILHLLPDAFGGGEDWLKEQSRAQWAQLKGLLDEGAPCPLGLIGATNDPFMNHQILAYGYEEVGDEVLIHVYDPNCPPSEDGSGNTFRVGFGTDVLQAEESCSSSKRGPLRGFFCEDYTSMVPPQIDFGTGPVTHGAPERDSQPV